MHVSAEPPATTDEIYELAKMATVAIPHSYAVGKKDGPSSSKYCVVTNWWKERDREGKYKLPTLDKSLYRSEDNNSLVRERMRLVNSDGEEVSAFAV